MTSEKVYGMLFSKVYPMLYAKAERKGRTKEEVEEPLMQEIRYLDKIVDELAKGKSLDKIKRK